MNATCELVIYMGGKKVGLRDSWSYVDISRMRCGGKRVRMRHKKRQEDWWVEKR
jgi:hypothetical protein